MAESSENFTAQHPPMDYRGCSFTGDLSNQDFSGADIRGAKFDDAILKGTKFLKAKTGLQWHWNLVWMIGVLLLCLLVGVLSTIAAHFAISQLSTNNVKKEAIWQACVPLVFLLLFCIFLFKKGVVVSVIHISVILAIAIPLSLIYDLSPFNPIKGLASIPLFLFVLPLSLTDMLIAIGLGSLAVNLAKAIFERKGLVSTTITIMIVAIVCKYVLRSFLTFKTYFSSDFVEMLFSSTVFSIAGTIAYIAYRSTREEDRELAWLQKFATKMIATTGTSFKNADLTDADFEGATLKNADFTGATITRTNWFNTKNLAQACVQGSYLEELEIRRLVIKKDGKNRIFDGRTDLIELNLQGADLEGASFIGSNLSEASLQNARLLNSKLVNTQLYRANLTNACLTGACIQNWGISTDTHLDDIRCDYVFMKLTDGRVDRRKPDDDEENFKKGEFSAFIAPFIKIIGIYHKQFTDPSKIGKIETLDFTHQKDDDPEAIIFALTKLAGKHTDIAFEVVSVYSVGQNSFNIGVAVTSGIEETTLRFQYKQYLKQYSHLSEQEKQNTLSAGNEEQIEELRQSLLAVRKSPGAYIIINQNINFSGAKDVSVGNINQEVAADTISDVFDLE